MINKTISPAALLFLFCLYSLSLRGQFKSSRSLTVSIDSFATFFDDIEIYMTLSATECTIPWGGFGYVTPTYSLVDANETNSIFYQKEHSFFSLSDRNCKDGLFSTPLRVDVPKEKLTQGDELMLVVSLQYEDNSWTTKTGSFTLQDIENYLKNPDSVFEAFQGHKASKAPTTDKVAGYITATKKKVSVTKRGVSILFSVTSDESIPDVYCYFYRDGVICSDRIGRAMFSGHSAGGELFMPYTSLFVPKGPHQLTYKVFGKTDLIESKELFSGSVEITQPQLYWLTFESRDANINVEGMDTPSNFLRTFSKRSGHGIGDAYYTISNEKEVLFTSYEAANSGYIRDDEGKVQTYGSEPIVITFWDRDGLSSELVQSYGISKLSASDEIQIRNNDKILNFNFTYSLVPVTAYNTKKSMP